MSPHRTTDTAAVRGQKWNKWQEVKKEANSTAKRKKKDNKIRWEESLESYSGRQVQRSRIVECCSPGQKSRRRPCKAWCVTSLFLSRSSSGKADQDPPSPLLSLCAVAILISSNTETQLWKYSHQHTWAVFPSDSCFDSWAVFTATWSSQARGL